jgi:hypothetical protein
LFFRGDEERKLGRLCAVPHLAAGDGVPRVAVQSFKYVRRIDKFTCVMEAKTFNSAMMRNGALSFVKAMTAIDQDHYPERLNAI